MIKKIITALLFILICGCAPEETPKNKENIGDQDIFRSPKENKYVEPNDPIIATQPATQPTQPFIRETRIVVPKMIVEKEDPQIKITKSEETTPFIKIEETQEKPDEKRITTAIEEAINSGKNSIIYVEKTKENIAQMSMKLPDNSSDLRVIKWLLAASVAFLAILSFCSVYNFFSRRENKNTGNGIVCSCG